MSSHRALRPVGAIPVLCQPVVEEGIDFEAFFAETRDTSLDTLRSCIDTFPSTSLQIELDNDDRQRPGTLPSLLSYSLSNGKLAAFKELLRLGIEPEEHVVEDAAWNPDEGFLIGLLNHGWPIDHSVRDGQVPSLLCLTADRPQLFQELLRRGADLNALSTTAETAVSSAVRRGPIDLVRQCLEAGADTSIGDLIHAAVDRDSDEVEMIRLLCSHNAPVNNIRFNQPTAYMLRGAYLRGTPLHQACRSDKIDVVKELLRQGANPNSTRMQESQIESTTPIDIATKNGYGDIVALLKFCGEQCPLLMGIDEKLDQEIDGRIKLLLPPCRDKHFLQLNLSVIFILLRLDSIQ